MIKTKILLIDDDALVAKSLQNLLMRNGYDVVVAGNAKEGISKASLEEFVLVISDIRMPGQSGIVAIQKIKELYETKGIRCAFILITGYSEEDTPEHAIRLGVNKFLFKPFDNEELLKAIKEEIGLLWQAGQVLRVGLQPPRVYVKKDSREKTKLKRVMITGVGAISPNGIGKEAYWQGLRDGKNCVSKITFFDCSDFPSKAAAEIRNFNPDDFVQEKNEIKRMGRSSHLGIAAARLAVQDANIETNRDSESEAGVIIGSAVSGLEYVEVDFRSLERSGVRRVRPYLGIAGFGGAVSSEISRALSVHGPSLTISTGCTSSTDAMGYAMEIIRNGKADLVITGGTDACVTPGILAAFCQMGAVTTRQSDFQKASRPFNKDRDGFVLGEGAWIFIFEELEHALKRKSKIYGEVIGYGATCDAWHMAKPHPSGEFTARAIQIALEDAEIQPEAVDLFEAYGNGTPVNDSYETAVVKKVFGKHAYNLAMPSIKSMLGHPLGASGAQQLAATLMAFKEGIVHPTINYEMPDPECDLDYVPNKARKSSVHLAVCSSIAFGAKNSALVARSFKTE